MRVLRVRAEGTREKRAIRQRRLTACAPAEGNFTRAYPGTVNDKTMVKSEDFIKALKVDPLYSEYEYTVFDRRGVESELEGLYATVDGGHLRCPQTLDGYKSSLDNDEMLYQEHQASVRKDVECRLHDAPKFVCTVNSAPGPVVSVVGDD